MKHVSRRAEVASEIRSYMASLEGTIAPSTRRAYKHDLETFWVWARASHLTRRRCYPVPLAWLKLYLIQNLEGLSPAVLKSMAKLGSKATGRPLAAKTMKRRLGSLSVEHTLRGVTNPCNDPRLVLLMRRAKRLKGQTGKRRRAPITSEVLVRMLNACGSDLRGTRDKALLMVGFAGGGRRRSELSALKVNDLKAVRGGYVAELVSHKTAHLTGESLTFPILGEPAKALDRWMKAAKIKSGQVFRGIHRSGSVRHGMSGQTVNRVVQRLAARAGYPSKMFGAHSLRSGFMTQAAREGIPLPEAMLISGHRSVLIAYSYYRGRSILESRAARLLGP